MFVSVRAYIEKEHSWYKTGASELNAMLPSCIFASASSFGFGAYLKADAIQRPATVASCTGTALPN